MQRLKTAFKKQSYQEASNNFAYWSSKTKEERFEAAQYLISVAYDFPLNNPPKLDRTVFAARKRE